MNNFHSYLEEIEKAFQSKLATEHSYRHALINLIESFRKDIQAINEPKRRTFGAPDYIIRKREIPLGYIEAKDIGKDLDKLDRREKEQLKKYTDSLNNLIYTNYLDFRWYVRGEVVATITLADFDALGNLHPKEAAETQLTNLINEFLTKEIPTVATPKELAQRMASTTKLIRQTIEKALEDKETAKDTALYEQFESFQKTLLPNLKQDEFADLYSQTIAYGLFTARCFDTQPPFTRKEAAYLIPKTNPFLKQTFDRIGGINLDERIVWAVDDLAELLNRTDISAILQDFGKRTRQEDPVVHFYETFLAEYDPKLRETRGVYYTPEPVVSYIVRSVDKILQNDFGMPKGLADSSKLEDGTHRVLILDPATGTGTFLYNVIKNIAKRYENNKGMWDGYVSQHLLPRLFGFELLVAPYAVAHLKLGLLLEETGYKFDTDERLRIYLNNTLDFARLAETSSAFSAFINSEAKAGREIQQDKPVMVILGNPPYSGHSANTGKWINDLLRGADSLNDKPTNNYFMVDGKPLGERNPKWLNDDYVKFIRFSQWRIDETGYGILAFVTNHGYLDNPTFRGMRQSLMKSFDEIYIVDLHGNSKKKEKSPDGSKDENVFDIQQGVAIGIFIKKQKGANPTESIEPVKVFHKHLYGVRESWTENVNSEKERTGGKYHWLLQNDKSTTEWNEIQPTKPYYLFIPQDETLSEEYNSGWKITNAILENNMGITTGDDNRFVKFSKDEFDENDLKEVQKVSYRIFDERFLYYKPEILARSRVEFMQNLNNKQNVALCVLRRPRNELVGNFFVTKKITDKCVISSLDNAQVFPLYIYPTEAEQKMTTAERLPNFSDEFIKDFSAKLNLEFLSDGKGDLIKTFAPEDIFNYAYAVFHSPTYRARYAEFLKIDFPRLPLTSNVKLFRELVALGSRLVELHLLEKDIETDVTFPIKGTDEVEKVEYKDEKVYISNTQYFGNIPEDVWNFHIGGYQVLHKWLKDRKGRTLSYDDKEHYEKVVSALSQTIELMQKIDETIDDHGGFPIN